MRTIEQTSQFRRDYKREAKGQHSGSVGAHGAVGDVQQRRAAGRGHHRRPLLRWSCRRRTLADMLQDRRWLEPSQVDQGSKQVQRLLTRQHLIQDGYSLVPLDLEDVGQLVVNRQSPLHDLRSDAPQSQVLQLPGGQPHPLCDLGSVEGLRGWL